MIISIYLLHFFLPLALFVPHIFSTSCSDLSKINDDYCDCENGEDENRTSACSSYTAQRYFCTGSGILNVTIPTSRVQDGICDCCDGSDELHSPFQVICPNTCKDSLYAYQRQTLKEYQKLSSGLQAKNELINVMKRKKLREQQSFLALVSELEETEKVYYRMRIYLEQEELSKEADLQFQELRRRVRDCADQYLPVCDIFGDGIDYMIDDTSLPIKLFGDDNEEEEYLLDLDEEIEKKGKGKVQEEIKLHEEEAEKKASQQEQIRKSTMSALQRVHSSYCSHLELDVRGLLVEETPRVHKSVQQYLAYHGSRGGIAEKKRQRSTEMMRKKTTLFGRFLDNGREGYLLATQVFCEFVGIILSPLTVPLTFGYHATRQLISTFWLQMKECSHSTVDVKICPEWKVDLATSLREGGTLSIILDTLDYTQYNLLVRLSKSWSPFISTMKWYLTLIQQAPWYYYRYYLSSQGVIRLPVKRDACTLREGIRVAKEEMTALKEKIEIRKSEEEEKKKKLIPVNTNDECPESEIRSSDGTCLPQHSSARLDYSQDGSWEALDGLCLEKEEGGYVYKVCLFQSAYQGSTRLGSFKGWGDHPHSTLAASSSFPSSKTSTRFGSKINSWTKKVTSALMATPTTTTTDDTTPTDYSKQFYDGGDRCHNGIIRHAVVLFHCSTISAIEEVVEYEICGYQIKIGTPLACSEDLENKLLQRLKELEVIGYQERDKFQQRAAVEIEVEATTGG